ncbi:MAG: Rrf2 family transcriptional regulator, partial [uncultured Phycisphaerae bacterium]
VLPDRRVRPPDHDPPGLPGRAGDDQADRPRHQGARGVLGQGHPGARAGQACPLPAGAARRVHARPADGRDHDPRRRQRDRPDQADHHLPARAQVPRRSPLPAPPAGRRRAGHGRAGVQGLDLGRAAGRAHHEQAAVRRGPHRGGPVRGAGLADHFGEEV